MPVRGLGAGARGLGAGRKVSLGIDGSDVKVWIASCERQIHFRNLLLQRRFLWCLLPQRLPLPQRLHQRLQRPQCLLRPERLWMWPHPLTMRPQCRTG